MTKKDFIALANAIREHNRVASSRIGHLDNSMPLFDVGHLETLASFCKQQNYAFMRDRWFDYIAGECGPNGGKVAR